MHNARARITGLLALTAGVLALSADAPVAEACGGCFAPQETIQSVTDHRMVMSIGPTQSVLWDQIRYTGAPQDFSWVLPVIGDVDLQLASAEFFDRLEAATAPVVQGPAPSCPNSGGGSPFLLAGAASPSTDSSGGVTVLRDAVVGPYQMVTLRSTDPQALTTWLRTNNYVIPASVQSVISGYVALHADFVALRLRPGQGVGQMQPVRVVYHSANMVLPLRMVAAGIADKVGLTLWVFGAGRYEAANFGNATINPADLVWSYDTNSSNFQQVFEQTLRNTQGGRAWITESAGSSASVYSQLLYSYGSGARPGMTSTDDPTTDLQLATGNNNSAYWVTRMRTSLGAANLDVDLQLQPSSRSTPVSRTLVATRTSGGSTPACAPRASLTGGVGPGLACAVGNTSSGPASLALPGLALALGLLASRRRRA